MNARAHHQTAPSCKSPEHRELWRRLVWQYGYDKAKSKFHQTDPETRSDLMAWRYLGRQTFGGGR